MIDKKLTIFQVSRFFNDVGGAQSCFIALNELLQDKDHKVIVLAARHNKNIQSVYNKYFVKRFSQDDYNTMSPIDNVMAVINSIWAIDVYVNAKKLIKKYKPDIADIHNIYYQISPSIFSSVSNYDIPIVQHLHDYSMYCINGVCEINESTCTKCMHNNYYYAVKNKCYLNSTIKSIVGVTSHILNKDLLKYQKHINKFIVTSHFQRKFLSSWGLSEDKMEVLPLFFDKDKYPIIQDSREENIILFSGEMKYRKGPTLIYELAKRMKNIQFVLAGRGPYTEILSLRAKNENINNLIFYDYLDKAELFQIVSKSLLIIMPSLFYESFGRVIIEAFAHGKPVVGSRIGSIPEIIKDSYNGFTFEPGNILDLFEKVDFLVKNTKLRHEMGFNARRDYLLKYSKDIYYNNLMKIYKSIL